MVGPKAQTIHMPHKKWFANPRKCTFHYVTLHRVPWPSHVGGWYYLRLTGVHQHSSKLKKNADTPRYGSTDNIMHGSGGSTALDAQAHNRIGLEYGFVVGLAAATVLTTTHWTSTSTSTERFCSTLIHNMLTECIDPFISSVTAETCF